MVASAKPRSELSALKFRLAVMNGNCSPTQAPEPARAPCRTEDVCQHALLFLMPDWANRQVALVDPKNSFRLRQPNLGFPELFVGLVVDVDPQQVAAGAQGRPVTRGSNFWPFDASLIIVSLRDLHIKQLCCASVFFEDSPDLPCSTFMGSRACFSQRASMRVSDCSSCFSTRCVMPFFASTRKRLSA